MKVVGLIFCIFILRSQFGNASEIRKIKYEVYEQNCFEGDCKISLIKSDEFSVKMENEGKSFASGTNTVNFEKDLNQYKLGFVESKSKEGKKWKYNSFGSILIKNEKLKIEMFTQSSMFSNSYSVGSGFILSLLTSDPLKTINVKYTLK